MKRENVTLSEMIFDMLRIKCFKYSALFSNENGNNSKHKSSAVTGVELKVAYSQECLIHLFWSLGYFELFG